MHGSVRVDAEIVCYCCKPCCKLRMVVTVVLLESAEDAEIVPGKLAADVDILLHCLIVILLELPDDLEHQIGEPAEKGFPCGTGSVREKVLYNGLVGHSICTGVRCLEGQRTIQREDREN